jgi:anthranilate phosphoribosyltransferase
VIADALRSIVDRRELTPGQAAGALEAILTGASTPALTAAFLAAFRMHGETPELLAACHTVMEQHAEPVDAPGAMDVVGTGADGADTFNVSTAAAIVVAACGVPVAKHGNRAATSQCGSADVLEALGANLDLSGTAAARVIRQAGFCFLFAQRFHPAMRYAGPVRREIGIRTVFNVLGPLTNPARPRRALVGVGRAELAPLVAGLFALRELDRTLVVHSTDGLDEISPAAPTRAWLVEGSHITEMPLDPSLFGLPVHVVSSVAGGDAATNAATMRALLGGERNPVRDFVLINAGAALWVAGKVADFRAGSRLAAEAIDSGAAAATLQTYIRASQEAASG